MLGLKIPCRGSPEAPSFSGHPEDLQSYFDDISDFCDGYRLSDGLACIKLALKYVPFESADLWSHFVEESGGDWTSFTSEVGWLYPELEESRKNRFFRLRSAFVCLEVISLSSLGEYFHSFCHYWLSLEKQKGSTSRLPEMFYFGFPPEFRHKILECHSNSLHEALTVGSVIGRKLARAATTQLGQSPTPPFIFILLLLWTFGSYTCKLPLVQVEIPHEVAGRTLRDRLDNWASLTSQPEYSLVCEPPSIMRTQLEEGGCVHRARTVLSPTHLPARPLSHTCSPPLLPPHDSVDPLSYTPAKAAVLSKVKPGLAEPGEPSSKPSPPGPRLESLSMQILEVTPLTMRACSPSPVHCPVALSACPVAIPAAHSRAPSHSRLRSCSPPLSHELTQLVVGQPAIQPRPPPVPPETVDLIEW
ncbi:hypothetical protein M404DRAFT_28891 [Pisolithus tinctorius Marx 270]|uniref:Uncharacterized protein n=1 Tax=Pisolithus tinctorius Marx 270 TaxID=870435 RepID=A0A0C3P105_PISTI|nr:hypothetical protein M404DRAFT_28891 [Pisolithus tinctorius Marx 270]